MPETVAMTQKKGALEALMGNGPDSTKSPIKTTKSRLTAPQKSWIMNFPAMSKLIVIIRAMKTGRMRKAKSVGGRSTWKRGNMTATGCRRTRTSSLGAPPKPLAHARRRALSQALLRLLLPGEAGTKLQLRVGHGLGYSSG
mmetsp:Transcript_106259/g.310661  ORF Transcript_106259/g.310661 Transcript_106259/m.310661 type:complete len:141 (-) Transcript_106259:33-455(-)